MTNWAGFARPFFFCVSLTGPYRGRKKSLRLWPTSNSILASERHHERSASPFKWTFTRRSSQPAQQDGHQTAGSRCLTEYLTVIPNVST